MAKRLRPQDSVVQMTGNLTFALSDGTMRSARLHISGDLLPDSKIVEGSSR